MTIFLADPRKKTQIIAEFLKKLQHNDCGFVHVVNYTVIVGLATCTAEKFFAPTMTREAHMTAKRNDSEA